MDLSAWVGLGGVAEAAAGGRRPGWRLAHWTGPANLIFTMQTFSVFASDSGGCGAARLDRPP